MRSIKVSEGQTLLDIAVEHCGDINAVYTIADLNLKGITDDLVIGEVLIVPDVDVTKADIVEMFKQPSRKPASGEDLNTSDVFGEGLEFWIIEEDFVIS